MHRTIGYLSKRLVYIKAGEGRKVWLTCLYFFLVITAYYVIKPVSRSLVLGDLGSRLVPHMDLLSALAMGPLVAGFARLVDRVEKRRLVSWTFGAVTIMVLGFWWLLRSPAPWVSAAFYVWVSVFSVLVVTLFWLVANDLYHPREAKRLFGIIGSGGILGGIFGSGIAAAGARLIGTRQLLLCSGALLLVCWIVVQRLWRFAPADLAPPSARPAASAVGRRPRAAQLLFRSRYLILLVGLVGIAKIVSTLIYYQFNPFIEAMYPTTDAKTAFTGMFFGWMNVASFLIQFVLTSWVLRRMGLMIALAALPAGLLGASLGLLLVPAFWIAATAELYDGSMNYSLQQTTKEVLYLPIERSIRYKVKPFIDMVVFRFGKGLAAVIGIFCLDRLHLEARVLGYISVPLIVLWLVLAVQLRADYVRTIRRLLKARATVRHRRAQVARRKGVWAALARPRFTPAHPEEWLESLQPPHAARQKIIFARQLFSFDGVATREELEQLFLSLERHLAASEETNGHADLAGAAPELLRRQLADSHQPFSRRAEALRALVHRADQEAVDAVLGLLLVEEDIEMRHELIRGLVTLRLGPGPRLEFPKRMIRRQIAKEVGDSERIVRLASIYHRMCEGRLREQDPFVALLRLLMEESTLRMFWLLSLVCRPEDIYLIYKQVRESDGYLRADALELLDNLVDPGLRGIIFPVLDEDYFLERVSAPLEAPPSDSDVEAACGVLRSGVHDHNRWLNLMIVWLAGQLRLESLWPDLDAAAQRQTMLVPAVRAVRRMASPTRLP